MTNVTMKKVGSKDFARAKQELVRLLSNHAGLSSCFVDELLTESEQVMLVKRFAAILMYKQGYSQYRVWNTLYLSPSTAKRIYENFDLSRYEGLEKAITRKKASGWISFIEDVIAAQSNPKARARVFGNSQQ